MDLQTRPLEATDLSTCAAMLEGHLAYSSDLIALLPDLWRGLLADEALNARVVEAGTENGGARIVGFAAGVFISDAWLEDAEQAREPYLTERTLTTDPSPILRPPEIGRANGAGGLNILNLHYCEAPALPGDLTMALRYQMLQGFIDTFGGYRTEAVVQEMWDEIAPEFIVNGWGSVRSDYTDYFAREGLTQPPPGQRPYLVGVTREETQRNPGDLAAPLFLYSPPRLRFTRGEKALLRQALIGRTDNEIAARLDIAVPTVKSRWRAIYQRVSAVAPELVDVPGGRAASPSRGQEKRRNLLEYLRRHGEELRRGVDERLTPG